MAKEEKATLEKVIKEKIEPIVIETTKQAIGVTVEELNRTLIDKIASAQWSILDVNTSLPYKKAKNIFRKMFFTHLIQTHYGNISDVANITGIDRRTIHRIINELGIDIFHIRRNLLNPDHYLRIVLDATVKGAIEQYRPILNPEKMEKIYKDIPRLESEVLTSLPKIEMTYKEAEEEFDRQYLSKALKQNNLNVSLTARKIGLRYETLHRKLKVLGLSR